MGGDQCELSLLWDATTKKLGCLEVSSSWGGGRDSGLEVGLPLWLERANSNMYPPKGRQTIYGTTGRNRRRRKNKEHCPSNRSGQHTHLHIMDARTAPFILCTFELS
jgi:hypothetical protein